MTDSILITGGGGFIGRNLILYLRNVIKDDREIIVFDNFKTSDEHSFRILALDLNVVLYKSDIVDQCIWENLRKSKVVIKQIYHLASIASPVLYKKYPLETLDVGYTGTKNVLEYSMINKSTVLFASSSEIYGEAQYSPQKEDYYGNTNTFGERSSYDCSKRVGEALMYTFKNSFGTNVRIARIFNTFGPHMNIDDGRLLTEIIKSILYKTPFTLYGKGTQKRSLCYVTDTVSMLHRLMYADYTFPVNIGNNVEMTVASILDLMLKSTCETDSIDVIHAPLSENDPLHRCPDLEINKSVLGETEYTSILEGLLSMLDSYF